jgi:hypothetical protein
MMRMHRFSLRIRVDAKDSPKRAACRINGFSLPPLLAALYSDIYSRRWPSAAYWTVIAEHTITRPSRALCNLMSPDSFLASAALADRQASMACPADSPRPQGRPSAAWTIASKQKSIRQSYRPMKSHRVPLKTGLSDRDYRLVIA